MEPPWVPKHLGTWLESHEIKKNSVVTGIEPTTSGLLDQRRSRSNNQAPLLRRDLVGFGLENFLAGLDLGLENSSPEARANFDYFT